MILTDKEKQILDLLGEGEIPKTMASTVGLTCKTINVYVDRLKRDNNCKTRTELVVKYLKETLKAA